MTGPEGIALAGIVLSALLGFLGYRTAKEAREDAHAQAKETREEARRDARDASLFERRKDVYEEVIEYAYRLDDLVRRTEPIMTFGGDPPPPDWPSDAEVRAQGARMAAWCTPAMLDKLQQLKVEANKFQAEVWMLHSTRESHARKDKEIEEWQKVEQQRKVVSGLVSQLVEMAARDLQGE